MTGSVDYSVKIWDYQSKSKMECIQTLTGHTSCILDLQYSQQLDTIFTCSMDKTIKIWKQTKERAIMYHPWYIQVQQIFDFSPKLLNVDKTHISSLMLKKKEHVLTLYAGDSEGSIHILKPQHNWKANSDFILERTNFAFHRLSIIQILVIEKENHVFTISYDQKIQGFDDMSGKKIFNYINPHKCLFTYIQWDYVHQELVGVDEQGNIFFISLLSEKSTQIFNLYKQRIERFQIVEQSLVKQERKKSEDLQLLIVILENELNIIKIRRGVKQGYILDEHTDSIIGLESIQRKENDETVQQDKIISCSLDGSIKVWDPKNMQCVLTITNNIEQEFNSFIYLPYNKVFCTGHEQGVIKMWNLDNQSSIQLDYKNNKQKHSDFICSLATGTLIKKTHNCQETYEYLFASGYDSRISVWEISEDNATNQSIISPQLKTILMTDLSLQSEFIDTVQPILNYKYENIPLSKKSIGKEILALAFYQSNSITTPNQIFSAGNTGVINIHEFSMENKNQLQNLFPFKVLEGHSDSVNTLKLDQNYLFSGSDDKSIIIWDVTNYFIVNQIHHHHSSPIKDILIIQQYVVSCAFDGFINIYDYIQESKIDGFIKNENFKCLAYLQKDRKLFVGTDDKNIFCFDFNKVFNTNNNINDSQLKNHKYDSDNVNPDEDDDDDENDADEKYEILSGDTNQYD